jgi:hypothetical protein
MSVQIATNGTEAAAAAHDRRIEQYTAAGKSRSSESQPAGASSPDGAVLVDVTAAVSQQNQASAATNVHDLAAAQKLVSQLVSQLTSAPAGATAAPGSPSPRAVLSLLG